MQKNVVHKNLQHVKLWRRSLRHVLLYLARATANAKDAAHTHVQHVKPWRRLHRHVLLHLAELPDLANEGVAERHASANVPEILISSERVHSAILAKKDNQAPSDLIKNQATRLHHER